MQADGDGPAQDRRDGPPGRVYGRASVPPPAQPQAQPPAASYGPPPQQGPPRPYPAGSYPPPGPGRPPAPRRADDRFDDGQLGHDRLGHDRLGHDHLGHDQLGHDHLGDDDEIDDDEVDEDDDWAGEPTRAGRGRGRGRRAQGGGHGHSHGGGQPMVVSRRTQRIVLGILIPCAVATLVGLILLWPGTVHTSDQVITDQGQLVTATPPQRALGEVQQIFQEACTTSGSGSSKNPLPCGNATIHITSGPGANQNVVVALPQTIGAPRLSVGDKVVLTAQNDGTGGIAYIVIDEQRGQTLLLIVGLLAVGVVVVGLWQGVAALTALGVSLAGLLFFIIPALLNGASPLPIAIVGAAAIMFVLLYLTHGFSMATSVAVLGTLASLVLTGLLSLLSTSRAALTGVVDDNTTYLSVYNGDLNMRGLLVAGMIIGALGVLNDVTITQALTIAELAPNARSRAALFRAGMRVGRAHISSAVNTIILAYAGESLPVLLLIYVGGQKITDVITGQYLGQEVIRAAVGAIGLVAAVPITTGLAALVADIRPRARRSAAA